MNSVTPDATRRRATFQILLLAAGFLVLVAISVASVLLVNKARKDNAMVVHTVEVENQIDALLLEIRRAESAARGYLLTLGPDFRRDYESALANIIPDADKLAQLTRDNPVQVENVKKLRLAIETRLDQFGWQMNFVNPNQPADATALVREAAAGNTARSQTPCTRKRRGCSRSARKMPIAARSSPPASPSQAPAS